MAYPYSYGGYPGAGGYYTPPMPDQLAQLRAGSYQQPMHPMMQNQTAMPTAQNQMQQTAPIMPQQQGQPASMTGPVFVNGEAGAKGFLVAAGNTVMLIDADPDANTFWLKSADASGMPSMRTFDYVERVGGVRTASNATQSTQAHSVEYVTVEEFKALSERADALAAEVEELKARKIAAKKLVKGDDE